MTVLYRLHLSKDRKGFGKPSARAVQAVIAGNYVPNHNGPLRPDQDDVRMALPHQWRVAFDRTGGMFWFASGPMSACYCTLRDKRGKWVNTIYAVPYVLD